MASLLANGDLSMMLPPNRSGLASLDGRPATTADMLSGLDPDLDPNRAHHLLKHSLSDGQRVDALAHFETDDVKDAAKEISKMGQRDLQGKFRMVYGTATHSNNNDWLRRKLYEAIGAAPIKVATKSKPRKPAAKARKAVIQDPVYQGNTSAGGSAVSGSDLIERRSSRIAKGFPSTAAAAAAAPLKRGIMPSAATATVTTAAESMKRYRLGVTGGGVTGGGAVSSSLPGSPVVGRSVLDMHRYLGHESATTSASEEDSEAWQEAGSHHRHHHHVGSGGSQNGSGGEGRVVRRNQRPSGLAGTSTNNGTTTTTHAGSGIAGESGSVLLRPASAEYLTAFAPAAGIARLPTLPPHLRRGQQYQHQQYQQQRGPTPLQHQEQQQLQFQQRGGSGALPRRASSAGLLGLSTLNSVDVSHVANVDVWSSDAWVDAALTASAARRAPAAFPSGEDEDVMMLSMDLSAFDDDSAALLDMPQLL